MEKAVRVEAVLADEVHEDIQLAPFLCADITDKTQTSNIIRVLSKEFPLPEYSHLKRVKGGEVLKVLICGLESESKDLIEKSSAPLRNLGLEGIGSTSVVWVPQHQPITRAQYSRVSQLWPTHFHEDKMLEKVIRGDMFSPGELADVRKFMKTVLSIDCSSSKNNMSSSVVIVDPGTKEIITRANTDHSHPLKHATMLCLDKIATHQGGGAWNKPPQINIDEEKGLECRPPTKRAKTQYLCTGYDVYCSIEPCLINPSCGGLYSQYKIHTHKNLNHHFQVYRCIF